jgi:CheY-like chemotaxis protein
MKLLIADDNAEVRALLRRLFAKFATELRECADGQEAIQAFKEFNPDWTIMDISMPRLDGLAATRQILASHPAARIIVLTEYRGIEYERAALETGACKFMLKDDLVPLIQFLSAHSTANQ